jgi:Zn-dependent protease with chaperone function
LQAASERSPRLYDFRVAALAVLGYGFLVGVLLTSTLVTLAIIALVLAKPNAGTVKLGLIFGSISGGLAYTLAKALWVRLEAPTGVAVTPADAPDLFALLTRLRARFNGPRFHHVLLTGDYNAAVVQIPRLGVFGWQSNYLLLGLPLMQSLAPEEFEAVLAHEFGHLSRNHARFGAWIYRVRRSWERTFEEMARQPKSGSFVLEWFIRWFWPKFNAHAFVLARANEYVADRCAAEFSGAPIAARALTRVNLHAALLDEKFWPSLFKRVNAEPEPPRDIYMDLARTLQQTPASTDTARWLKAAFTFETNNGDTHPALKDRLRALGRFRRGSPVENSPPRSRQ